MKEPKNEAAQSMARKRWSKTTHEERLAFSRMMQEAKRKKKLKVGEK